MDIEMNIILDKYRKDKNYNVWLSTIFEKKYDFNFYIALLKNR
jgi:hypothetical protein